MLEQLERQRKTVFSLCNSHSSVCESGRKHLLRTILFLTLCVCVRERTLGRINGKLFGFPSIGLLIRGSVFKVISLPLLDGL